jgi:hypothetical protein
LSDEHDKRAVQAFIDIWSDAFATTIVPILEAKKNALVAGGDTTTEAPKPATPISNEALAEGLKTIFLTDPRTREKVYASVLSLGLRDPPVQGQLTRQGALIVLVSTFEGVIAKVIQAYYERYPQALSGDDRTITLTDLRASSSIEEAERRIIEKEVDAVLRDNTSNQLSYLTKKLKVELTAALRLTSQLVEISQRRNLYVHNSGIANRYYIDQVDADLVQRYGVVNGEGISLSSEYLLAAIDTMEAVATAIIQSSWRKWEPEDGEAADGFLVQMIYEALREHEYAYVGLFTELATLMKFYSTDIVLRILTINHAIALRENGQSGRVSEVIDRLDWSAASPKFVLAVHVLRDQKPQFLELLPKAIACGDMKHKDLSEWPLFKPWRGETWFDDAVARHAPRGPEPQV